jgi:hypothetical protein
MISLETERQIRAEWQRKADRIGDQAMTFTIEIDEYSLEQTAEVLAIINPGRSSKEHIEDMVRANMWDGTTSLGTAGWEATGYFPKGRPGVLVVRLSVNAYTVKRWLAKETV